MNRSSEFASVPLMTAQRVSLIGGLMVAIGPIAMALYTPAMPGVVAAYEATKGVVKLTLTLYFAGFAISQLVAGPLSDAIGRRPVTVIFAAIFCVASLGALMAPTIEMLTIARFAQGIGASAGVAISRAIVRDCFQGDESSRIMNMIGIILAIGPAVSPTIGGLLVLHVGWKSVFAVMILFGLAVALVALVAMRETLPAPQPLRLAALGGSYLRLLGNRHFMTASLTVAGSVGAIYAQATLLPFILMGQIGLSPSSFGLAMLLQSGLFFSGALVARSVMKRTSAYRLVWPGLGAIALGALFIFLLLWADDPKTFRVMVPVGIYAFGIAFVMPAMSTAALAPFPRIAGAAAALMGFLQMGAGLLIGTIGAFFVDTLVAFAVLIPSMAVVACVSYAIYRLNPHLAEPEPRENVIGAAPPGRTFLREE